MEQRGAAARAREPSYPWRRFARGVAVLVLAVPAPLWGAAIPPAGPPVHVATPANLLENPGFESGSVEPWIPWGGGSASREPWDVRTGEWAVALNGVSSVEQVIAVDPSTHYTLRMHGKVNTWGGKAYIGVSEYGYAAWKELPITWTDFQERTITFETAPGATSAKVSYWNPDPEIYAVADDFELLRRSAVPSQTWFPPPPLYRGSDLSYVNEMEDCGAVFRSEGRAKDPFQIFAEKGNNLVRVRIWNDPSLFTNYSNFEDAARTILRAKEAGMGVCLDFHYSDFWADPGKQARPVDWDGASFEEVRNLLYEYTHSILFELRQRGIVPEMVQVGNEINNGMIWPDGHLDGTDQKWWDLGRLLESASGAVRDIYPDTKIIVHVGGAEGAYDYVWNLWNRAHWGDFDVFAVSFYPWWSPGMHLQELSDVLLHIREDFGYEVLVAETGYPWTLEGEEDSGNIVWDESQLMPGYPATVEGQRAFYSDLFEVVVNAEGRGVVLWEPAWVSTDCWTPWGPGSSWENATLFDFGHNALASFDALGRAYPPQLIVNPGFERGNFDSWNTWDNPAVSIDRNSSHVRSGWFSTRLDGGVSVYMEQRVAVRPGAAHEFKGFGKVQTWNADTLVVGIKDYGGPELREEIVWTDFQEAELRFTPWSDSVTVYLWNPGPGATWGDDFRLLEVPQEPNRLGPMAGFTRGSPLPLVEEP